MEEVALAGSKKNAAKEGRIIVFVDESGLTEKPHRVRTWAPKGETPVLQHHFHWNNLSAIAGITFWNFYFRLFPDSIKSPQVILFLEHLLRHKLDGDCMTVNRTAFHQALLGEVQDYLSQLENPANHVLRDHFRTKMSFIAEGKFVL